MIMEHINAQFPHSIYVTDVGQHQMWATQYLELDEQSQLITSGGLGTMGFGFPAAIGAKIANPKKPVVCITGDGGFQMNIQEMATAVTQGTGITICLLNNNYLGMVRQMQELFYGKRYSATCLRRRPSCPGGCKGPNDQCPEYVPDFVKLAESYGAYGIRVEKEEDIDAAFAEAKKHTDAPTIIEFMIATDELVLPMVKSGNPMSEMILNRRKAMSEMKKRWIALYVENDVGVLAKVSGLFSGKSYNLQSLTVGTTEDETVSRMTISVESDDITFEQIKKQLNRMVEVIKVIDLTNVPLRLKELMFVKIMELNETQMTEVFQIAQAMRVDVVDIGIGSVMLECRRTEQKHDDLIAILKKKFKHISVVRGGSVAIESISTECR